MEIIALGLLVLVGGVGMGFVNGFNYLVDNYDKTLGPYRPWQLPPKIHDVTEHHRP